MKRFLSIMLVMTSCFLAQAQILMKVEKTDGSVIDYPTSEIKRVFFESTDNPTPAITIPEIVDLGLSVKWASFNIGATKPEEAGGYYAWGETEEKEYYDKETYKYNNVSLGLYICGTPYDVVYTKLGGSWRLPTIYEFYEMDTKCTRQWTSVGGVNGYKITGPNGNSIFLPAVGLRYRDQNNSYNEEGKYLSGSVVYSGEISYLNFDDHRFRDGSSSPGKGYAVRAVYDDSNASASIFVSTISAEVSSDCNATLTGSVTGVNLGVAAGFIIGNNASISADNGEVQYLRAKDTFNNTYYSLEYNTTYYYRAFAFVNGNYIYGDTKSFTTPSKGNAVAEAVDLGLSVKWASFNLGASKPEEYGSYLSWSEAISPSAEIRSAWGESWRLPTLEEVEELANKCTKSWETVNGIKGLRFTASNGNSVFFPAGGEGEDHRYIGDDGNYWTSTSTGNSAMRIMYFNMTERLIKYEELKNYYFINVRYVYDDGQGVSPHNEETSLCPDDNHPHMIDLGIGVKWACCNVGASKPEDYGGYYAWGETEEKSKYDANSYKYRNSYVGFSKYCTQSSAGKVDNKTTLDSADDAAFVNWGAPWRMPTSEQIWLLLRNCTSEWINHNGIDGRRFTGPNGNSIFIPAGGYRYDLDIYSENTLGSIWSSSLNKTYPHYADELRFDSNNAFCASEKYIGASYYGGRYWGRSIRPIAQ